MRRLVYIYDRPGWPDLRWDKSPIIGQLAAVRHRQGHLLGRMEGLGFRLRAEATLRTLTEDAVKSSEIEGERLDSAAVRSSLARRLGMDVTGLGPTARNAEAIADVVLDATQHFAQPLTADRLFMWNRALFPLGGGRFDSITVGGWRTDERGRMIIASGRPGRERIHFEAPISSRVPGEMRRFIAWFEDVADGIDLVLKAAIAHFMFVTIHPFDDGNGRIGRAIADMLLARSENTGQRFYSMSSRLLTERTAYYGILESTQKGDVDVTRYLAWFLAMLDRALSDAEAALAATLRKGRFWEGLAGQPINARQRAMLDRLLEGFDGKLTTSKWAAIAKCSQDTALRDIADLLARGILVRSPAGGRSTSYELAM